MLVIRLDTSRSNEVAPHVCLLSASILYQSSFLTPVAGRMRQNLTQNATYRWKDYRRDEWEPRSCRAFFVSTGGKTASRATIHITHTIHIHIHSHSFTFTIHNPHSHHWSFIIHSFIIHYPFIHHSLSIHSSFIIHSFIIHYPFIHHSLSIQHY
jgi:hypothetical protein